jgi:hypothetical protein
MMNRILQAGLGDHNSDGEADLGEVETSAEDFLSNLLDDLFTDTSHFCDGFRVCANPAAFGVDFFMPGLIFLEYATIVFLNMCFT